jgi:nitrogen fixation protein NifU and related proteins
VYGPLILEHFRRPRNAGDLADADRVGEAHNALCGDRVRIGYRLSEGRISEVRHRSEACAICTAAASILTERVRGMTPTSAASVTENELVGALESEIPEERRACAVLPLEALRHATGAETDPRIPDTEAR